MKKPKKKSALKLKRLNFLVGAVIVIVILLYCLWPKNETNGVAVYFFRGDKMITVSRPLNADEAPLNIALGSLLAGPSQAEKAEGLTTQLPPGTKLLGLSVKDKTAIINLSRDLETYGGGTARLKGMIAQIVYTATEIPGIEKAWLWEEGNKELVLGGEGLVIDKPLKRTDIAY